MPCDGEVQDMSVALKREIIVMPRCPHAAESIGCGSGIWVRECAMDGLWVRVPAGFESGWVFIFPMLVTSACFLAIEIIQKIIKLPTP